MILYSLTHTLFAPVMHKWICGLYEYETQATVKCGACSARPKKGDKSNKSDLLTKILRQYDYVLFTFMNDESSVHVYIIAIIELYNLRLYYYSREFDPSLQLLSLAVQYYIASDIRPLPDICLRTSRAKVYARGNAIYN